MSKKKNFYTSSTWLDCINPYYTIRFYTVEYSNSPNSGQREQFWFKFNAKRFMNKMKQIYEYVDGFHSITGNDI
jgi:hypothetical protein